MKRLALFPVLLLVAGGIFYFYSLNEPSRARPNPLSAFDIVTPSVKNAILKENTCVIAGHINDARVTRISINRVSTPRFIVPVGDTNDKSYFTTAISKSWPEDMVARVLKITIRTFQGDTSVHEFGWEAGKETTLKGLWASDVGKKIIALVNEPSSAKMRFEIAGMLRLDAVLSEGPDRWYNAGVSLAPGDNAYEIIAHDNTGSVIAVDSLRAFYAIENVADAPSSGYEKYTFHNTPTEAACRTCHPVRSASARNACSPCHDLMWRQRFTHTPTKQRRCTACHDSASATYAIQKALGSDAELCYTCHTKEKASWSADTMKRHAPVDNGQCVQCHSPHGSPNIMHTVAPINKICSSCHDKHEEYSHPISRHPHQGVPEGGRPGREMSCAGCHEPHAVPHANMLRYGPGYPGCVPCHQV